MELIYVYRIFKYNVLTTWWSDERKIFMFFNVFDRIEIGFDPPEPTGDPIEQFMDTINAFLDRYKIFIAGVLGLATMTMIILFVVDFIKLAAENDSPMHRHEAIHQLIAVGISTALLGSITVIFGLIFNLFD